MAVQWARGVPVDKLARCFLEVRRSRCSPASKDILTIEGRVAVTAQIQGGWLNALGAGQRAPRDERVLLSQRVAAVRGAGNAIFGGCCKVCSPSGAAPLLHVDKGRAVGARREPARLLAVDALAHVCVQLAIGVIGCIPRTILSIRTNPRWTVGARACPQGRRRWRRWRRRRRRRRHWRRCWLLHTRGNLTVFPSRIDISRVAPWPDGIACRNWVAAVVVITEASGRVASWRVIVGVRRLRRPHLAHQAAVGR